jgi:hypothetical protein
VQDAWLTMQIKRQQWNFLRQTIQWDTTIGQASYTLAQVYAAVNLLNTYPIATSIGGIRSYIHKTGRASTEGQAYADEQILNYMDWSTFRNVYLYATQRTTQSRQVVWSEDPARTLWFAPVPNAVYRIEVECELQPQMLSADADAPLCPVEYHMAIVWKALMDNYAGFESAPEVLIRAGQNYKQIMDPLEQQQLPPMQFGPPVA